MDTDVIDDVDFMDDDDDRKQLTAAAKVELNVLLLVQRGDMVEKDTTSCDSKFMLDIMPEVAAKTRQACHWMPETKTICLGMDNAGGHGTNETKESHTSSMKEKNIEIAWQSPRSPETNMLNISVLWMSIQSTVTRTHRLRRCNHDALAKSVHDAWERCLSKKALKKNVHGRLKVVIGGDEIHGRCERRKRTCREKTRKVKQGCNDH